MALRVLLADESVTIKKVIQLALQDFAVEVKAVPVGLDVLEVSKSFQPDLVFADILLQKRSGYEVCGDLKKDPKTAAIPVVLMWSSFMELDQRQVDACGADGRLEKPFEVEALRKLVLELVPRTRSQRLAHFLEYPSSVASSMRSEQASVMRSEQASVARSEPPPVAKTEPAARPEARAAEPSAPPRPRMPPPLSAGPRAAPTSNPFGTSLGAPGNVHAPALKPTPTLSRAPAASRTSNEDPFASPIAPAPASTSASTSQLSAELDLTLDPPPTSSMDFTPTPGIPDRPAPSSAQSSAPLGALPDLQLEGQPPEPSGRSWNMESFEPLDLGPLSLDDDDTDQESFQPIQLPQAEPSASPLSIGSTLGAALSLTNDDDDDAEADQWSNKSLDKYRLAPLKPDESLAVDDMTPDFAAEAPSFEASKFETPPPTQVTEIIPPRAELHLGSMSTAPRGRFELDSMATGNLSTDKTEIIPPTTKKRPVPVKEQAEESAEDLPEFSLTDDDFSHTSRLEIEHVDQAEKSRPAIVRELLRDPDFSYGEETVRRERDGTMTRSKKTDRFERTMAGDGVIDLSSAGEPAAGPTDNDQLEAMVRQQVAPQLEKVIEKIVAQLLPQIAERIIKRELERLLEES